MMRYLLSLCSIAVALSAGAGGIAMKTGEWQFILDPQNGNLVLLAPFGTLGNLNFDAVRVLVVGGVTGGDKSAMSFHNLPCLSGANLLL